MVRKLCSIGTSHGVSIPKEILKKLHLIKGSQVEIKMDEKLNKIIIEPTLQKQPYETIDKEFASQTKGFISLYKPALKELARK